MICAESQVMISSCLPSSKTLWAIFSLLATWELETARIHLSQKLAELPALSVLNTTTSTSIIPSTPSSNSSKELQASNPSTSQQVAPTLKISLSKTSPLAQEWSCPTLWVNLSHGPIMIKDFCLCSVPPTSVKV